MNQEEEAKYKEMVLIIQELTFIIASTDYGWSVTIPSDLWKRIQKVLK